MKRALLASVGLLTLAMAGQPSVAADIPTKAPASMAPVAAPMFNWSGFYGGVAAGAAWGREAVDYDGDGFIIFGEASRRLSNTSFIGGGQFGYNFQGGVWVYGIEADIAWRDTKGGFSVVGSFNDTLTVRSEQKWLGTVRTRFGFTPTPNALLYVTGGLAYGRFERFVSEFCDVFCGNFRAFSGSKTKSGWTVGGGYEVLLNQNWSFAIEYLYVDFGTDKLSAAGSDSSTVSFDDRTHVAWAKLNYRFASGKAPVVAGY